MAGIREKLIGFPDPLNVSQMTDVNPNRWRNLRPLGREDVR
jgi:hypothetical protein